MKPKNGSQWPRRSNFVQTFYMLLSFLFLKLFVLVQCSNNNSLTKSLDIILHEHAFNTLIHQHTGSLYNATVPSSLAGMKLTLVRLRSRTLWEKGANFSGFSIPPRTIPVPYVKRIHIVYNDMGNLSTHYFNISGYNLLTSVIGFIVYDAPSHISTITSLRKLDLRPMGQPISIEFKNLTEMIKGRTTKYCAMFDENGKVSLSVMRFPNLCYTRNHGHFTIVLPSETRKKKRIWGFLVIGFVIGLLGVGLVALVGRMVLGIYKSKKTCEMEREAEEGEILESVIVGRSKMPVAMVTRTHPILEGPSFP
ncbi:hypothetical protein MTR67_037363 [Solanum verrucosum]|uniref:Uncharacterized protein n=2 Tax=Solanum TaxID=4107 RepID=A0AAF0UDR7_SOLVR|nr:hypothetical protein MTR67_037363 [Solanum verrucosum]